MIKKLSSKEIAILFLSSVIFFALSIFSILKFSIWHDEGYTATLIENSYIGIIERTRLDVHPPLYYLTLKTWSYLFGDGIISLRLFSTATMFAGVVLIWLFIRKNYGYRAGAISLVAMSIGPIIIRYSQEMRMYGMLTLIISMSTILYVEIFSENVKSLKIPILYGVTIAAGLYTQYFYVLVLIAHALHYVYVNRKNIKTNFVYSARNMLIAYIVALAAFLPWLPTALSQFVEVQGAFWIEPVGVHTLTNTPIFNVLYRVQDELTGLMGLIALAVLIGVIVSIRKCIVAKKGDVSFLLLSLIIIPPAVLFLISIPFQPSYHDRYLSYLTPFFYSAIAIGLLSISSIKYKKIGVALYLSLLVIGQINQLSIGNDYEKNSRPYFTMNEIVNRINDSDPVYSTSLTTFFDAKTTVDDSLDNTVELLQDKVPDRWAGNWSALYGRDLIITTVPDSIKGFWLIDESSSDNNRYFRGYAKISSYENGYARISKYTKAVDF